MLIIIHFFFWIVFLTPVFYVEMEFMSALYLSAFLSLCLSISISIDNRGAEENKTSYFLHRSDWRDLRDQVLTRDNYICSDCKKSFYRSKDSIHIHHIVERFQGGEDSLENLRLLCKTCHRLTHEEGEKAIHLNTKKKIIEEFIKQGETISISYRGESLGGIGNNSIREIRPEKLYSKGGHIYLDAYCLLRNEQRSFRVSRIIKFHEK